MITGIIKSLVKGILPFLFLSTLFLSTTASVQGDAYIEKIPYYSANLHFFRDILVNPKYKKNIKLTGKLELPDIEGQIPVVIIQHGSGHPTKDKGTKAWKHSFKNALFENGIGIFTADSFTGRGIRGTGSDQSKLSSAGRVLDALSALEALANHPRVNPQNIGIIGTSLGGYVSHLTSYEPIADAVLPNGPRFVAHIGMYSSCSTTYRRYRSTGAPVLFLSGGADDWTPAAWCAVLAKNMKKGGGKVETKIYPKAHHTFISSKPVKYWDKAWIMGDCDHEIIEEDGNLSGFTDTRNVKTWKNYAKLYWQKGCLKQGASSGGNAKARAQSLLDATDFFTKHLK